MVRTWIIAFVLVLGCKFSEPEEHVVLPQMPPDTVVVSWSVISRSTGRKSVHAVLQANRTLTTTTRSADGTMMSATSRVSEEAYAELVRRLRTLDCCSLESTTMERPDPAEAKPRLELNLGDVRCDVELWDHEWLEGRARECGFTVAQVHRVGFVPDPPVDDPGP